METYGNISLMSEGQKGKLNLLEREQNTKENFLILWIFIHLWTQSLKVTKFWFTHFKNHKSMGRGIEKGKNDNQSMELFYIKKD